MSKIKPEFIQAAQEVERLYKVPAAVVLAQFAVESAFGKKDLGVNNYFGMKFSTRRHKRFVTKRTVEVIKGKRVTVVAKFAAFNSAQESFLDLGKLLSTSSRYRPAMAVKDDSNEFARQLEKCGYATDPLYAEKLIAIMTRENLYQFNQSNQPNPKEK
jgi:flagellar protein FlgJ